MVEDALPVEFSAVTVAQFVATLAGGGELLGKLGVAREVFQLIRIGFQVVQVFKNGLFETSLNTDSQGNESCSS